MNEKHALPHALAVYATQHDLTHYEWKFPDGAFVTVGHDFHSESIPGLVLRYCVADKNGEDHYYIGVFQRSDEPLPVWYWVRVPEELYRDTEERGRLAEVREAERSSESKTESALLALGGPPVTWNCLDGSSHHAIWSYNGQTGMVTDYYAVYGFTKPALTERRFYTTYSKAEVIERGPSYSTMDDAKAACERHHSTGAWD